MVPEASVETRPRDLGTNSAEHHASSEGEAWYDAVMEGRGEVGEPSAQPVAQRKPGTWRRCRRAFQRELAGLHPRLLLVDLFIRLLPHMSFGSLRRALYRLGGISIGRSTLIAGRMHLIGPGAMQRRLRIGARCFFTTPLFADLTADITIGDDVTIGHHVVLVTADHEIGSPSRRAGEVNPKPIVIESGAWIAASVTVLPGARIGAGAVVGAGSLVKGEIPPHVLAVGVPARVLRPLDGRTALHVERAPASGSRSPEAPHDAPAHGDP
jgi:carbonic anhydrase/acetyltransferase-like protein (isoleucine patch superfamily)